MTHESEVAPGERPPVTDNDRRIAAEWLGAYLADPSNMDLIRIRLGQQAKIENARTARFFRHEVGRPARPSIISIGFNTQGGYGNAIFINEDGLHEVSFGPGNEHDRGAASDPEPTTPERAVHYFEDYMSRDPRDLEDWLARQLADIEATYKAVFPNPPPGV